MHRRALEERNMMLGLNHPDTYTSFHNFALMLEKQDKCEAAEAMYRWALERREKVLGPEHTTLAGHYRDRYEEAEVMHRRALEGME